jgi:hypothetical protein
MGGVDLVQVSQNVTRRFMRWERACLIAPHPLPAPREGAGVQLR